MIVWYCESEKELDLGTSRAAIDVASVGEHAGENPNKARFTVSKEWKQEARDGSRV